MKSKKGFTLVEIIAVIVIIVIVSLMAVPAVLKMIKNNKESAYQTKLKVILKQAKQYASDNENFLHSSNYKYINKVCNSITVKELQDAGYLKEITSTGASTSHVIDPRTGNNIDDKNIIVYINSSFPYDEVEKYNGGVVAIYQDSSWCNNSQTITEFAYSGDEQTFTVERDGYYKIQVWGAQGGSYQGRSYGGGLGGFAEGVVHLTTNDEVYVYVGGSGDTGGLAGGFNGGGAGIAYNGGGGATDVRVEGNTLYHRIIVAGGGGSGGRGPSAALVDYGRGGVGGGLEGGHNFVTSGGGTQTAAGSENAGFGYGEPARIAGSCSMDSQGIDGSGGGGWYGGSAGTHDLLCMQNTGGGGGSGFVYDGTNAVPAGYSVLFHRVLYPLLLTGESTRIPTYDETKTMTGNSGNGHVKITLVSPDDL